MRGQNSGCRSFRSVSTNEKVSSLGLMTLIMHTLLAIGFLYTAFSNSMNNANVPLSTNLNNLDQQKVNNNTIETNLVKKKKIVIVGGGNFGTAISNRIALNLIENPSLSNLYDSNVTLWIYDEIVNDKKLSEIINETHENIKYLPGIILSPSIHVETDINIAINDADVIILVTPHQFLSRILSTFPKPIKPSAIVVSMIKGVTVTNKGPQLISDMVQTALNTTNIAVVMGANLASEVAQVNYTVLLH